MLAVGAGSLFHDRRLDIIDKAVYFVQQFCLLKGLLHCFSTCIEITGNNITGIVLS